MKDSISLLYQVIDMKTTDSRDLRLLCFFASLLSFYVVFSPVLVFSDGYYVRLVYETSKNESFMRSEEVYESGDVKIVTVTAPERFTWVKVKNKWYIGDGTTLYRTYPIKDLLDIATEYVKANQLDISRDGTYKFCEEAFTLEIATINGEIAKIVRKVGNVVTTMYINKFPKQFDIKNLLSKYTLVDKVTIPEEFFKVFSLFLWMNVTEKEGTIKCSGYDMEGSVLELEINKTNGDIKVDGYYLKVIKASEKTLKEIKNALRNS